MTSKQFKSYCTPGNALQGVSNGSKALDIATLRHNVHYYEDNRISN